MLAQNAIQEVSVNFGSVFIGRLAVCFFWGLAEFFVSPSLDGYKHEKRGDESFLQIGEAEAFGDVCDGFTELWREVDGLIAG